MSKFIIFFDIETGSLAEDAPIIQLAGLAINEETWAEVATFETKIQFDESRADEEALKINHYDREVWKRSAVPPAEACRRFSTFIKPYSSIEMVSKRTGNPYSVAKLAGYNAVSFDGPRLRRMYAECNAFQPFSYHIRDVMQRAMFYIDENKPENPPANIKLATMCEFMGIEIDKAHDALSDVRATAELARRLSKTKESMAA